MSEIGCKTVCREIDELGLGQEPDARTRAHLRVCASCHGFYDDRLKLRQMISDLDTVAAPGDFDFRLRARLANERDKTASPFSIAGFGFGLPSVALALIAILVGVGFFMRTMIEPDRQQPFAKDQETVVRPSTSARNELAKTKPNETTSPQSNPDREAVLVADETAAVSRERHRSRKGSRNSNFVRRDEFLAKSDTASFPLEAAEPLRVSVDYAAGGSRTISLPAVSFGSQQVVASGASMVKTSARTVW